MATTKEYYWRNREAILAKKKERYDKYGGDVWQQRNPEAWAEQLQRRMQEVKDLSAKIKLTYGCQHPDCKWVGEWDSSQLDLHHLDPATKDITPSHIKSVKRLIVEARKCTVLCACCHRKVHSNGIDTSEYPACDINDDGSIRR